MHLDKLEQYGRRENLEIHGVQTVRNKSTNQIVKTVAKALNVQLHKKHISTSNRLKQHKNQKETCHFRIEINATKYSKKEKSFNPINTSNQPLAIST